MSVKVNLKRCRDKSVPVNYRLTMIREAKLLKNRILITVIPTLFLFGLITVLLVRLAENEAKNLAREFVFSNTGYELTIAGDLEFKYFPSFGVIFSDVRVRNQNFSQELASASELRVDLTVETIFGSVIDVQELSIHDLHMNLLVNPDGENIWRQKQLDNTNEISEDETSQSINYGSVSIEKIRVLNASMDIQNASQGYRYNLSNINFESNNTNLNGLPFEIKSTFSFLDSGMTNSLPVDLQSTISLGADLREVEFRDINFLITPMILMGSIDVSNENNELIYDGAFQSNNFDVVALMRTAGLVQHEPEFSGSVEASETLSFGFDFKGGQSELALESFQGNLGETVFQAKADVRFKDEYNPYSSRYELRASRIDLSPFIGAISNNQDSDQPFSSETYQTQDNRFDLPLDIIKDLNLLGSVAIESITANEFAIEDVNLFTNLEDGVLDIELQPTNLYGGNAQGLFRIDTNQPTPEVMAQLSVKNISMSDITSATAQELPVQGRLSLKGNYEAFGENSEKLLDTLAGSTEFSVAENSFDISLIKQIFTEIASLSPSGESIQQWPDIIQFNQLQGGVRFDEGLTNQEIELRLDNLNILSTGGIDLEQRAFDYYLEFSFLTPPETQTIPINELYQNIIWPVRCNARFDSSTDQYCRPDFSRIREIFSQLSTNAVRQIIEDEITEQVPQFFQEPANSILREILN